MSPPGSTAAVRVEPVRLAWIEALIAGDDVFTERFSIPVVPGWVGFPEALPAARDGARRCDADPWGSQLIFDETDGALVGFGGFKGAPANGEVEIGYAIAPARRGRGLATAAATVMIERARAAGVRTVLAHTLAEPNPSTSVLTHCRFTRTATLPDPDLGTDVWRWELNAELNAGGGSAPSRPRPGRGGEGRPSPAVPGPVRPSPPTPG
jgi:RimJ/RimL family protein N-acetyltransferase